jgi:hypothetical protein
MSINNRKLKQGTLPVIYESKFQTALGKLYCLFKGHKKVIIKTDTVDRNFCICCWKEIE